MHLMVCAHGICPMHFACNMGCSLAMLELDFSFRAAVICWLMIVNNFIRQALHNVLAQSHAVVVFFQSI